MDRRTFVGHSTIIATSVLAGCASNDQDQTEPSEEGSETENESANGEQGPSAPEKAIEHYDKAVELLTKNAEVFGEVRQNLLLDRDIVDFSVTEITSRTSEARSRLDRAAQNDDGSLTDHIEAMRVVASYQDSLAEYNEEYIRLIELVDTGLDEYFAGRHQSGIDILQNAQEQIELTNSALEDVDEKIGEVQDAAEVAELNNQFREDILVATDQFAEAHEELTWLEQVIPARIAEIEGDQDFALGNDAFDNENYSNARTHYSDSERHFVSAETHLDNLQVREITPYIEELVRDTESLICEYKYSSDACDEMVQASEAIEDEDPEQANQHIETANTHLSKIDTC